MSLLECIQKYFQTYPNGDKSTDNCDVLFMLNSWRNKKIDGDETLDLKFFPLDKMPPLFCKQHEDCLQDLLEKRVGVYR